MGEFWSKYKNIIIWAIVIIVLLIILSYVLKWLKKRKRKGQFTSDYNNLVNAGQHPSYPETSYLQLADKIYEAGCPYGAVTGCYGTDEEAITGVFSQFNNELDVLLVVRAFGSRPPRGTYWSDNVDLGAFMATELDAEGIDEINKNLSLKGIKYRF